jgi:hypothetical protein
MRADSVERGAILLLRIREFKRVSGGTQMTAALQNRPMERICSAVHVIATVAVRVVLLVPIRSLHSCTLQISAAHDADSGERCCLCNDLARLLEGSREVDFAADYQIFIAITN